MSSEWSMCVKASEDHASVLLAFLDFLAAVLAFSLFFFSAFFFAEWFFQMTQRGAAMQREEYEPEIRPIIIGSAKLTIESILNIRETTRTEPIAKMVVIEVQIVLTKH